MKYILLILLLIILGCSDIETEEIQDILIEVIDQPEFEEEIASSDSIVIVLTTDYDTIAYLQSELDSLTNMFPELKPKPYPIPPKIAHAKRGMYYQPKEDEQGFRFVFSSEAGEDNFFILYSYFLKQHNGIEEHTKIRKQLIEIFSTINHIHMRLQYGGTYFGHQHARIHGFAEYAVYASIDNEYYKKEYDIKKQKKLFLDGLRDYITKEVQMDMETYNPIEKKKRLKEILKNVDKLDTLITSFFLLRQAQQFEHSYY